MFCIVARKDSRRLALDFQTLRPIIYFSAASAEPNACVCEVVGTISDSVRLKTCLVYCRTFSRTPKSASTAVAEHTGQVRDTIVCGGMVANRLGQLVLCFSDSFFVAGEVNTKNL